MRDQARGGLFPYVCRAIDSSSALVDMLFSEHRDMKAARAFFRSAKAVTGVTPDRVTTDGHDSYPRAIRTDLGKGVRHRTNRLQAPGAMVLEGLQRPAGWADPAGGSHTLTPERTTRPPLWSGLSHADQPGTGKPCPRFLPIPILSTAIVPCRGCESLRRRLARDQAAPSRGAGWVNSPCAGAAPG